MVLRAVDTFSSRKKKNSRKPERIYFIIAEGSVTEFEYFSQLRNYHSEFLLEFPNTLQILEKEDKYKSYSSPVNLLALARDVKHHKIEIEQGTYSSGTGDQIILVFDADAFRRKDRQGKAYIKFLKQVEDSGFIAAVTNPCFELYLLLHKENSVDEIIRPNEQSIYLNPRVTSKKRTLDKLIKNIFSIDSKKSPDFTDLLKNLKVAIQEEKKINQDINIFNTITSNVGKVIENIIIENKDKESK